MTAAVIILALMLPPVGYFSFRWGQQAQARTTAVQQALTKAMVAGELETDPEKIAADRERIRRERD